LVPVADPANKVLIVRVQSRHVVVVGLLRRGHCRVEELMVSSPAGQAWPRRSRA